MLRIRGHKRRQTQLAHQGASIPQQMCKTDQSAASSLAHWVKTQTIEIVRGLGTSMQTQANRVPCQFGCYTLGHTNHISKMHAVFVVIWTADGCRTLLGHWLSRVRRGSWDLIRCIEVLSAISIHLSAVLGSSYSTIAALTRYSIHCLHFTHDVNFRVLLIPRTLYNKSLNDHLLI